MSYRMPEYWYYASDAASRTKIVIDNGTICRISLPCFYWYRDEYQPVHDRPTHDHNGWPSPDHPDDSCQLGHHHGGQYVMRPIELAEEGYTAVFSGIDDEYKEDIGITGQINGNVIDITIQCFSESATDHDIDVRFSIYASGFSESANAALNDVVLKGILHVVAGNIGDASGSLS